MYRAEVMALGKPVKAGARAAAVRAAARVVARVAAAREAAAREEVRAAVLGVLAVRVVTAAD
jgi:hypothetical protein